MMVVGKLLGTFECKYIKDIEWEEGWEDGRETSKYDARLCHSVGTLGKVNCTRTYIRLNSRNTRDQYPISDIRYSALDVYEPRLFCSSTVCKDQRV